MNKTTATTTFGMSPLAPTMFVNAIPVPDFHEDGNSALVVNGALIADRESSEYNLPTMRGNYMEEINEDQIARLKDQGFTIGLAKSLSENHKVFPLRIWVVDNSGSMNKPDGHRIIETNNKNNVKIVACSRWEEINECVDYHVRMAGLLQAPTTFRLLNNPGATVGPQQFGVAEMGTEMIPQNITQANTIMRKTRPNGCTPLTQHVRDIYRSVKQMSPSLTAQGQRVAIIIATDGLPTDEQGYGGHGVSQDFVESLRLLEGLPVWVVIRLCTDEDKVVNFYNELDDQLELSLEVLDDFVAEAEEVYGFNKWLNYALPLHRCREMGFHDRVFDLIDERSLTKSELREFCALLFGSDKFDGVPDPSVDWNGFVTEIGAMLKLEKKQWNPIHKKMMPWIDLGKLNQKYGEDVMCCNVM
mmetsp:Transcript_46219/g.56002  ORF Transcript_46219/g.56002 Transcript_46219/m.56002 type:complete len:415 (-) Transcript_46219:254-1498(-)